MYKARVVKELNAVACEPPEECTVIKLQENTITISVQSETIKATLQVTLPERYPIIPPLATFLPPVPFHPNIDRNGNICLDLLKPTGWRPTATLAHVLVSIRILLEYPNVDDPLNIEAADLYVRDRQAYYTRNVSSIATTVPRRQFTLSSSSLDGVNKV